MASSKLVNKDIMSLKNILGACDFVVLNQHRLMKKNRFTPLLLGHSIAYLILL